MTVLASQKFCRGCGAELLTAGTRAIGVCTTCVYASETRVTVKPPGYRMTARRRAAT